jgi:hypothetical protein
MNWRTKIDYIFKTDDVGEGTAFDSDPDAVEQDDIDSPSPKRKKHKPTPPTPRKKVLPKDLKNKPKFNPHPSSSSSDDDDEPERPQRFALPPLPPPPPPPKKSPPKKERAYDPVTGMFDDEENPLELDDYVYSTYRKGKNWLDTMVDRLRKETQLDYDPLVNPPGGLTKSENRFAGRGEGAHEMVWAMGYDKDFAKRVEDSARFKRWLENGKKNGGVEPLSTYFEGMSSDKWRKLVRDKLIKIPGSPNDVEDHGNFVGPNLRTVDDPVNRYAYFARNDEPPIWGSDGKIMWFDERENYEARENQMDWRTKDKMYERKVQGNNVPDSQPTVRERVLAKVVGAPPQFEVKLDPLLHRQQRKKRHHRREPESSEDDGDIPPDYAMSQVPKHWRDPFEDRQVDIYYKMSTEERKKHKKWAEKWGHRAREWYGAGSSAPKSRRDTKL